MASLVPTNFPTPISESVPTFDAIDNITGTGHKTFFAVVSGGSGVGLLSPIAVNSQLWFSGSTATGPTVFDLDFDLPFERTHIMKGRVYTAVSFDLDNVAVRPDVYIRHVTAGGTETLLASISGGTRTSGANARSFRFASTLDIADSQVFTKDERLRVNIKVTSLTAGSNKGKQIYFDGANKFNTLFDDIEAAVGSKNRTDLQVILPFKIE